jgi:polyphenol oxidase
VVAGNLTAPLPGGGVAFSDRSDGNMSSVGGAGHEHGAEARGRLREQLGLRGLARGYQVHGAVVQIVREMPPAEAQPSELAHADGQATPLPGLGAMVLAADCLPVALGRPGAVAMLHAGWRGLAAGVLGDGVRAVRELPGGQQAELSAVLGPCAGPCCYEVGPEVHAALATGTAGRSPLDLRAVAREQLRAAGVTQVAELGGCTICDQRFFSYRREGDQAGRQAGVAWLS